jgi:hypothetical protein
LLLTLGKSRLDAVAVDDARDFAMWSNVFALNVLADLLSSEGTVDAFTEAARLYGLLQQHDSLRVKSWRRKQSSALQSANAVL